MSVYVTGFVLSAAFLAGPLLALAGAAPVADGITLVIAAPGTDIPALVDASGGRVIGPATAFIGALAVADTQEFITELQANGAWLVRDGTSIARLCGVTI